MVKLEVKKKPVRLRAGWRHDWYEPVPADNIVLREIVPGPFNSPQIVESSPFVLLSSDNRLHRPSQLRLPAELRAGRRCANLRTGIPDPWAEYLTFRGVPLTRSKVNPRDEELWSRQLDLTERAWKHFGVCMNQGIPDPWKNWPKGKTWQGVGSAEQKKAEMTQGPMGKSDINRSLPAEPESAASCRHEIKQSKSAPAGLSACCPCNAQNSKQQKSEIKINTCPEIPLSISPIDLCKCPESEQVATPLTLELPPEPACVRIAQLEEDIKPDVKRSRELEESFGTSLPPLICNPSNVDDTVQKKCESKLMIICHPKSSICMRQESKARKALKESKSKTKAAASPSCLCKPMVVKSRHRKFGKEENYCTNEKHAVSCPCQDNVSSSQNNEIRHEIKHADDPNAYICICSGLETIATKTKSKSKDPKTHMACNCNSIKTGHFKNLVPKHLKYNSALSRGVPVRDHLNYCSCQLEPMMKASPVIETCNCDQPKNSIKVPLKSSKSEESDRIAYYALVTGRNSNIKLNSSNNQKLKLNSNREFSFVLEENVSSKKHNKTVKTTNAKRMSVTEKNSKQELENTLVKPQRPCVCSQLTSQCIREIHQETNITNKLQNDKKCKCQHSAAQYIIAPIVNTKQTLQHELFNNEKPSFANNVSENENVQIEMPDLPLVKNILSSKKSPHNNNHQRVSEEFTIDISKTVKTVEIPVSWLSEAISDEGNAATDAANSSICSVTSLTIIDRMKVLQCPVKSEETKKSSSSESKRTTFEVNKTVFIDNDALPKVYTSALYLFPNTPAIELGISSELENNASGDLARNGQPSDESSSQSSSEVRTPTRSSLLDARATRKPRLESQSADLVSSSNGSTHSLRASPQHADSVTRRQSMKSQSADSVSSSNGSTPTLRASPQHAGSVTRRESMKSQCAEELAAMLALRDLSRQSSLNTPAIKKLSITSPKADDDTTATSSSSTTVGDSKLEVEYNASFIRLARSKRSQSTSKSDVLKSIEAAKPAYSKPHLELLLKSSHLIKTEKLYEDDDDGDGDDDDDSVVSHMTKGSQTQEKGGHKRVIKGGNASAGLSQHRSKSTMKPVQGATCNRKPNSNSPRSTCCECIGVRCTKKHLSRGALSSLHPTRMEDEASPNKKQLGNTDFNIDRHKLCFIREENERDGLTSQLSRSKMPRKYPRGHELKTKQYSGSLVIERGRIFSKCHNQIGENDISNISKVVPEVSGKQFHNQSIKTIQTNALPHFPHGKHKERDWKVRELSDTGSRVEPVSLKHKSKKKERSTGTHRQLETDIDRGWKDELSTDTEPRVDHVSPTPRCKAKGQGARCARSKHIDALKNLNETAIERSWKGLPNDVSARVETVRMSKNRKTRNSHDQHT